MKRHESLTFMPGSIIGSLNKIKNRNYETWTKEDMKFVLQLYRDEHRGQKLEAFEDYLKEKDR